MKTEIVIECLSAHYLQGCLEALEALWPGISQIGWGNAVYKMKKRWADGIQTLVALEDDKVVGTASLLFEEKFKGRAAHLEDVAVREDRQRNGIGRTLVNHCIDVSKFECCYKIILDCDEDNEEFYRKCGFYKHESQMRLDL